MDMKGKPIVIEKLNEQLADELTAVDQYMVHAALCANWGYEELHDAIEHRAIDEMKHAERLIDRIIFLEGVPVVSKLNAMHIGADVKSQLENDHAAEDGAIKTYNECIKVCVEVGDNGSRELFESILKDEEVHIDWLEAQLDQITQMGIQVYLGEQAS
jgi:bacterioferritin